MAGTQSNRASAPNRGPKRAVPSKAPTGKGPAPKPRKTATGGGNKKSAKDLLKGLSSVEESIKSINNLSNMSKQLIKYITQADEMLDTFLITGQSLKKSGLLDKIVKSKGKDLSSGDMVTMMMALMDTPLASRFMGGGSSKSSSSSSETEQAQQQPQAAGRSGEGGPGAPPYGQGPGQGPGVGQRMPGPYGQPYPYQQPYQPYQQPYQQQPQQQPQQPQQMYQAPPYNYPGLPPGVVPPGYMQQRPMPGVGNQSATPPAPAQSKEKETAK